MNVGIRPGPSEKKVRDALLVLGPTIPDHKSMFGGRTEVDPVRHMIGSAIALGRPSFPEKAPLSQNHAGQQRRRRPLPISTSRNVPVDGFWSITVYNAKGYLEPDQYNAYSLNNITARKTQTARSRQSAAATARFRMLPTMAGWNTCAVLSRAREKLSGTWKFPRAQRVN